MAQPIAIIGMACRYPDARTPLELWENVLAGRRAFRRLPRERLPLEEYVSADRAVQDVTYSIHAAVLDGYQFDRVRFRVSAPTFHAADLVHWLALDVAADALADAGFADAAGLPRATTGVLVGNTLTGEFSRATALRVRWPYVRRAVNTALDEAGETAERKAALVSDIESLFKAPFGPVDAETLAGSLSNTIAGRICNYFDLKGGGYTVDAACASSLLAIANACSALTAGDLDVAVAGGVDVSLDPFELVGFAKAGALAADEMRVYDEAPTGFWPGEGCGFVVLMREADAVAQRRRPYAVIRGWGVSSDGSGGMTRPELHGQLLAIERAYTRAGIGIDTVAYFEGHGTGTAVGDTTELAAISEARRRCSMGAPPAAIGSIKSNIGHTKAAAGVAGLLKATIAVRNGIVPPIANSQNPHRLLTSPDATLRLADRACTWPPALARRAGVSAMGFGGINVHVIVESSDEPGPAMTAREGMCARTWQDAELILLSARDRTELCAKLDRLIAIAASLSIAELTDLAVHLQRTTTDEGVRAALVASTPAELADRLQRVRHAVAAGTPLFDVLDGTFIGGGSTRPRIAFLFPGQGAPVRVNGGLWSRRFALVEDLYRGAALPAAEPGDTAVAQPAIVLASLAALHVLQEAGVDGHVGIGHSLGELTALRWAGALDDDSVMALARARGRLIADLANGPGAMAAIADSLPEIENLLGGTTTAIAALNGPKQTTVSGPAVEIADVVARARARGMTATLLPVAYAFHSPLMRRVAPGFREVLAHAPIGAARREVISGVTGCAVGDAEQIRALLERQLCEPVVFMQAIKAAGSVDLFIEVGPGHALSGLASACTGAPCLSVDAGSHSLRNLLAAIGSAFAAGTAINPAGLAEGRFAKPFEVDRRHVFLVNPCESVTGVAPAMEADRGDSDSDQVETTQQAASGDEVHDPCALLQMLVCELTRLPADAIAPDARFLTDLHLNSITVSELLAQAANRLGVQPLVAPTDYANASLADAARALETIRSTSGRSTEDPVPAGLDAWVRAFTVEDRVEPLSSANSKNRTGKWLVLSSEHHPLRLPLDAMFASDEGGPGVVVCLDAGFPPPVSLLLQAAQSALRQPLTGRFVIVQQDASAGGFARTLFMESGSIDVCVVTVDFSDPASVARVHAEACAAEGFTEARYDASGRRVVPVAFAARIEPSGDGAVLAADDVLLVTGGGKGLGAECALALATSTGVRLALLGRTPPDSDQMLAANLDRMRARGVTVRYVTADVGDAEQVRRAIETVRGEYGKVTAVLHAAGVNDPALIPALDEDAIAATVRPKVDGLRNILAAIDPAALRLFVTFGSLVARTGLPGEAHYALANEWLRELTEKTAAALPSCRVMCIEWSVWAATGMGERLGRLDSLARRGVAPIAIDDGIALMNALLSAKLPDPTVLVAGRFGDSSTLRVAGRALPFCRFLESPRVNYPGIELIADARLSLGTDPYLTDHSLDGHLLFPAVMGIEAMVEAAMALQGTPVLPVIERLHFARPIVVPDSGSLIVRVLALADADGKIQLALRTEASNYAVDHFRAVCVWPRDAAVESRERRLDAFTGGVPLDPVGDLYGSLLFQSGRFARVRRYQNVLATECEAEIADATPRSWFGPYLPDAMMLGDPGARDAVLHSIQVSIPHRRVVPVGVERIVVRRPLHGPSKVRARERASNGDDFTWDIEVLDAGGEIVETWEGVTFRGIGSLPMGHRAAPLLGPYVYRQLVALGHQPPIRITLESNGRTHSRAARHRRPDGRPEPSNATFWSSAHCGALTLSAAAHAPIGCDLECVVHREPEVWRNLLGIDRAALADFIARERHETADTAAARVWAACESLKKAGVGPTAALVFERALDTGWVTMRAGHHTVSTWIADRSPDDAIAIAVATRDLDAAV